LRMDIDLIIVLLTGLALLVASAAKWNLSAQKAAVIISISFIITAGVTFFIQGSGFAGITLYMTVFVLLFGFYIGIILFLFYRDPERIPAQDPDAVLSPADGTVIYIKEIARGSIPSAIKKGAANLLDELSETVLIDETLWQIGIAMMFTDVHVNRSPIGGRVKMIKHRPGKFLSLRKTAAMDVNERQTIVIENDRTTVGLVQIASRLVRRIEGYIREGDNIQAACRIGMIKFGSQVDLFIPKAKVGDIMVKEGLYLYAGQTVVCRLK
jgi:phosphatidylserine decarboxylase